MANQWLVGQRLQHETKSGTKFLKSPFPQHLGIKNFILNFTLKCYRKYVK